MNDKRDLQLAVTPMIEWCARYASCEADGELTNWELYLGNNIIAYNYDVMDGYIIKYSATWQWNYAFKLDVSYNHNEGIYNLIKKWF